jgi:hypothetical protein
MFGLTLVWARTECVHETFYDLYKSAVKFLELYQIIKPFLIIRQIFGKPLSPKAVEFAGVAIG